MEVLTGRCLCGAVKWRAKGPMLWAALCHCEDCRRAASSDFVSWFGVEREGLTWEGPRKFYKSSEKVLRSFCEVCGAPMSFETEILPDEVHLYAASLDQPEAYKPSAHIFWSEKLPWTEEAPDLDKHAKGLQQAALEGKKLL